MMKIIDAHLHLFPSEPKINAMTQRVGHENSVEHLRQIYPTLSIVHGVVMGNRDLTKQGESYPSDLFHYCVGLDSLVLDRGNTIPIDLPDQVEEHLKKEACCGVKLYPGYNKIWLTSPIYESIYRLAAQYDKPVAVHMGLTAYPRAYLKYSHPLALDEAAADNRKTRFVMCHFGNPFLQEAAAVLEKNPNVSTDLSGLLEGAVDLSTFYQERAGYLSMLQSWLSYVGCWDKIMYGSDWPIINLGNYISFIQHIIPEQHWEKVFYSNANQIYGLCLS